MQIYFDNAATSHPKPRAVIDAVVSALTELNANPGRAGHAAAVAAGRRVLRTRQSLADLLGAQNASDIAFTCNCTDALNLAIKGILRRGDHVIVTQLEHNSVLRVVSELARQGRIRLTIVPPRQDGFIDPDDIRAAATTGTALIVCTQASNVTGAIQPAAAIGQIADALGIPCLIDGAQALGGMPVNVQSLRCALYAFPGHKGLLGPQGTGGLYIRPGLALSTLREGGTGSASDSVYQPTERPERYESGTLNLPGIAGLGAGCDYVAARLSQIMMRERELCAALYEGLASIDGVALYSPPREADRAGIVCFNVGDLTSSEAADALSDQGFAVRGGLHCAPLAHRFLGTTRRGAVRASLGHQNTFEEIEAFLRAVHRISRGGA